MTTVLATRNARRFSVAEQAFIGDQHALKAYLNDRLPHTDWCRTERLVCETWLEALSAEGDDSGGQEEGLPVWLAAAARRVIARHTHPLPSRDVRWELLTQVLGHTSTWPEHWHRVLVSEGQAALLKTAAADLGPKEERREPVEAPARERRGGRVVPLPSAMPRRPAAVAA